MNFAIVGMDCVLPGAHDAEAWISAQTPAIREVPTGRWPMRPASVLGRMGEPDRTLGIHGAFVEDFAFEAGDLNLHDWPIAQMDALFGWTLHVVRGALQGVVTDPTRTALVMANLGLPTTGAVRATSKPIVDAMAADVPWLDGGVPEDRWHSGLPAQIAAQVFNFSDSVAVDAACASGLYAVYLAMARLERGDVDVAIAAAANRSDSSYLHLGFSQLRALSASGHARPLDQRADGLIIGEGAAAVVLKRLPDAIAAGDTIHAVLRGGGLAADGRKGNMLSPDASGQLRALQAAWDHAGLSPKTLGYVECHATGTQLGDGVELQALHALLEDAGATQPVAVASAKALIGHTVTAAGLAGLIRAVGAVRDGFLPGAFGAEQPHLAVQNSPHLTLDAQRRPWVSAGIRRAGVSAFGFGGTNAHLIVEAFEGPIAAPPTAPISAQPMAVVGLGLHLGDLRGPQALTALQHGLPKVAAPVLARGEVVDLPDGTWLSEVCVDPRRFKIPPLELAELLPQQLLMLDIAADALAQAPPTPPTRTASVVGMGVDHHIAEQVVRWAALDAGLEAAFCPPLNASRVQGHLPNFVANRIAAQFDLQGPSWTTSSGNLSGLHALDQASLLLSTHVADTVLVGAVDLPGHAGAALAAAQVNGAQPITEGAIALVLMRLDDAKATGSPILGIIDDLRFDRAPLQASPWGRAEALDGLLSVVHGLATGASSVCAHAQPDARAQVSLQSGALKASDDAQNWSPVLAVPHSPPGWPQPARWLGNWSDNTLPIPIPGNLTPRSLWTLKGRILADNTPLDWSDYSHPEAVKRPTAPTVQPPRQAQRAVATSPLQSPAHVQQALAGIAQLANQLGENSLQLSKMHGRFLEDQIHATTQMGRLAEALERASLHLNGQPISVRAPAAVRTPRAIPPVVPPVVPRPRTFAEVPRTYDFDALIRHANGPISSVFGSTYADIDGYEPRVRMPMPPLLLCSRVVHIEGERGQFGPSRIVTEYDIPVGQDWTSDGRPPPCVMIESGQADLFLVSFLGIDAELKGDRIYRLLDCDLTFHGPVPKAGETLRHDIKIDRFARLGATTLFYFHYDCTAVSDGRSVLSMRNGVAGFFTPAELAIPKGVDATPTAQPQQTALEPLLPGAATTLSAEDLHNLSHGRFADCFGPGFTAANDSKLRLPDSQWRLIHRVPQLTLTGAPYGLGEVVYEQDLRDDDWFNPCHFVGDPCMPGTLMYDGCMQAVQLWLLGQGVSAAYPNGSFDPLAECSTKLRCRGQVVPGHSLLTYRARIKRAGTTPTPWAIADVILEVDGTPVVLAEDVGVCVSGERVAFTAPIIGPAQDKRRLMEYSVGSAVTAFGPAYANNDGPNQRCARMPGPPYLTMSEVVAVDGPPMDIAAPRTVEILWEVPERAWFWGIRDDESMPYAILLETALQPCGWLTAYQGGGIVGSADLYFRNLGGTGTQLAEVWPHTGPLRIVATQTSVSASGGMQVQFFESEVWAGDQVIFRCKTHFGYFTKDALGAQKGLMLPAPEEARIAETRTATVLPTPIELHDHVAMPRDDWRMVQRITHAGAEQGAHGLGFYQAEHIVDNNQWFFWAHFHLDPVMPGSLGLEALLQLARFALVDAEGIRGDGRWEPILLNREVSWKYRGQVLRHIRVMTVELDVIERSSEGTPFIRCAGTVRADGLPIYRFEDFGLRWVNTAAELPPRLASEPRATPTAALLDQFHVNGDSGHGVLHLNPDQHPWLADHCPTVTTPAVPMAFAAEIAAEAASLLAPGLRVIGLPVLEAQKWIHTGEGPIDLLVVAAKQGDTVAVSLAVHEHNHRFPKLSGPKVHMRAVVQLGTEWAPSETAPTVQAPAANVDVRDYYDGGHTFHGPTLQGMTALHTLGPDGATATFHTRADSELLGIQAKFLLDPLLLDTATHPMMSASPERWSNEISPGHLAYPIGAENLRFFGPRPSGTVQCVLQKVHADAKTLVFDVHLSGVNGPWCAFRWTEAVVPAGPYLSPAPAVRRQFLWDHAPADVHVGRPTSRGWRVDHADLIEPLEGTLAAIACAPSELRQRSDADDPIAWTAARLAAKEAALAWLFDRTQTRLHPRDLEMLDMRSDRYVIVNAPPLDAESYSVNLGPTRVRLHVQHDATGAEAWLEDQGRSLNS